MLIHKEFSMYKFYQQKQYYFIKSYSMKIGNWSSVKRTNSKRPSYQFTSFDKQETNKHRQPIPITSIAVMHYSKREKCPNLQYGNHFDFSPIGQDQTTTAHLSTKGVYDSRKEKCEDNLKYDWKILTLKQIKNMKEQTTKEPKMSQSNLKGSRKIFVSISKSNRSSLSKEKKIDAQPKLAELGGDLVLLRSISNKRRIIDMVELQMEENIRTNRFFCN